MAARQHDLEITLLHLKDVIAQRRFRKPYLSLKECNRVFVDAAIADLLRSLEADLFGIQSHF